jgi:RNA polymerase sigma factor (TIGR02999 family)
MAESLMGAEPTDHTLQATGLVHEVWLRLLKSRNAGELERGEFLGLASQAMRRILTDHARRKSSAKRGGAWRRTTLAEKPSRRAPAQLALGIDRALSALEASDPELARLVELRFYGEASVEELGRNLGLSPRTVKRRYRYAKAWLQTYMQEHPE